MKNKYIIIILIISGIVSCNDAPQNPNDTNIPGVSSRGALILCEGKQGMSNASLMRYDLDSAAFQKDFYKNANPGYQLGDVANDIVIKGDTAYIVVSNSRSIERIRVSDGKSLGRIVIESFSQPRHICIINDSIAFVSDFVNASLMKINIQNMTILEDNIKVGPVPEGLAVYGDYLFVANSGAGDILKDEPDAGTVYVMDINTMSIVKKLIGLYNVTDLLIAPEKQKLYAVYLHWHEFEDSLAGITEYDINTLEPLRNWRDSISHVSFSTGYDSLIYISNDEVKIIDLTEENPKPVSIIKYLSDEEYWYSVAISPYDNTLWVGNAKNYQINGEILIYDINGEPALINSHEAGVIPTKIVFF